MQDMCSSDVVLFYVWEVNKLYMFIRQGNNEPLFFDLQKVIGNYYKVY